MIGGETRNNKTDTYAWHRCPNEKAKIRASALCSKVRLRQKAGAPGEVQGLRTERCIRAIYRNRCWVLLSTRALRLAINPSTLTLIPHLLSCLLLQGAGGEEISAVSCHLSSTAERKKSQCSSWVSRGIRQVLCLLRAGRLLRCMLCRWPHSSSVQEQQVKAGGICCVARTGARFYREVEKFLLLLQCTIISFMMTWFNSVENHSLCFVIRNIE